MLQFRMHWESGITRSETEGFWRDVFAMLKDQRPDLRYELRAKDLPDSVIQSAVHSGINFRIATKFWMEQMGLPFHPTHVNVQDQANRRHGYADLLRYPKQYSLNYRMFNGGTERVLLWGDPEYARRFAESSTLWDGDGFEVNEPLITKMEGQTHDTPPFALLNPPHQYYVYEFERYWHFYQTFGRMGYNTHTPADVFDRPFVKRFGPAAGPLVGQALHRASWVLPRIVAADYNYRDFPMTIAWPEKQHLGSLLRFSQSQGSDTELFASFDEEARQLLNGGETAKIRPPETSHWFQQTSDEILRLVADAEHQIGEHRNNEFDSTIVDLKILANLALYHSRRIPAAVNYRLYELTRDPAALDDAIAGERSAIEAWRQIVAAAGDFYAADMMMGARRNNLCGHWRDELPAMETELKALIDRRASAANGTPLRQSPRYQPLTDDAARAAVSHRKINSMVAGNPLPIAAVITAPSGVKSVNLRYRALNQTKNYLTLAMQRIGDSDTFRAVIPADEIDPAWDLVYFIEVIDNEGNGTHYPEFEKESPYVVTTLKRLSPSPSGRGPG